MRLTAADRVALTRCWMRHPCPVVLERLRGAAGNDVAMGELTLSLPDPDDLWSVED